MAAPFRLIDEKEEVMIVENNQILRVGGGEEEPGRDPGVQFPWQPKS